MASKLKVLPSCQTLLHSNCNHVVKCKQKHKQPMLPLGFLKLPILRFCQLNQKQIKHWRYGSWGGTAWHKHHLDMDDKIRTTQSCHGAKSLPKKRKKLQRWNSKSPFWYCTHFCAPCLSQNLDELHPKWRPSLPCPEPLPPGDVTPGPAHRIAAPARFPTEPPLQSYGWILDSQAPILLWKFMMGSVWLPRWLVSKWLSQRDFATVSLRMEWLAAPVQALALEWSQQLGCYQVASHFICLFEILAHWTHHQLWFHEAPIDDQDLLVKLARSQWWSGNGTGAKRPTRTADWACSHWMAWD